MHSRKRLSYNYVKEYITNNQYELLSKEYINSSIKLDIKCNNNHKYSVTFHNFQAGWRCPVCKSIRNSGEGHFRYNPNRNELQLNERMRIKRKKKWIINNMKHDPNYDNFLLYPDNYVLDHIIPVSIFIKIMIHYNLNELQLKRVINNKNNLQLLTIKENRVKCNTGSIFLACNYLMLNNVKLFNI